MKKLGLGILVLSLGGGTLGACSAERTPPVRVASPLAKQIQLTDVKGNLREATLEERALPENWFTRSPDLDQVEGVRADQSYAELAVRTGTAPIVVAVVDSGLDISHEDLQGQLWTNPGEVAGNGIDDDANGFVDDVHGWNFLGGVDDTTLEVTREKVRMKKLKAEREAAGGRLTKEEQDYLDTVASDHFWKQYEAESVKDELTTVKEYLFDDFQKLKAEMGIEFAAVTRTNLEAFLPQTPEAQQAKDDMLALMGEYRLTTVARVLMILERMEETLTVHLNEQFDPRAEKMGDDPSDLNQHSGYGDANVFFGDASHGTHVSGIIGAARGNSLGIDGVATDVRIMAVRAVPNGDEYDKDVANAIRYAVDNGAKIINMSFGKMYSPYKAGVDAAFQYAADHGVLVVHAAGNDSTDIDLEPHFPNPDRVSGGVIPGWLTVGASSAYGDNRLPAVFTNYGIKSVDVFAPGVDIRSTVPTLNEYAVYSGTSMATPVVSGIAALVLSQFPALTGTDLRALLMASVRDRTSLPVLLPGAEPPQTVLFNRLSVTGGVVDAYTALRRAGLGTRH